MKFKIELKIVETVTSEQIAESLGKAPTDVTQADAEAYAKDMQESWAGSNDGSELLMGAYLTVEKI